eukprot:scaffold105757_cov63-Phaeocystis_antarctica.AAC.2
MARLDRAAVLSQPLICVYLTSRPPARDGPQMQLIQRDSFVSALKTAFYALAPLSNQSRPSSCPWILAQALFYQTPAQAVRSPRRT